MANQNDNNRARHASHFCTRWPPRHKSQSLPAAVAYPLKGATFNRRSALSAGLSLVLLLCVGQAIAREDALGAAGPPAPSSYRGPAMVTGVADGDTLYANVDGHSIRIRLAQIDAPEKAQAFGRRSEQSLRALVGKKQVELAWKSLDRYGRPIAQVSVDGLDVNAEQVRRGLAWVFRRYSNDPALIALEAQARSAGIGLWGDPQPVAPWNWRDGQRE
jgi:micrococcal nuclease